MQEKMKRICLILPGKLPVPNIKGGAIETLLTLLLEQNEIQGRAHFIVICAWAEGIEEATAKYKNTEFYFFRIRSGIWKKGINFINYLIAKATGNIDFFKTPMHYDVEHIIKGIQADVVVVEHGIYKHFGFLRKYFRRDQLYLHMHGMGPMIDRETKNTFGHLIAVSEYVKKFYEDGFKGEKTEFHVCVNGIADEYFKKRISQKERNELRKKIGVNEEDTLVIYCGRLVHEKGVKEIINGVLSTENEKIKLMLVGGSNFEDSSLTEYVKELQKLVKDYSDRIFFIGYIPNNQLYQYYQAADVQVLCSICEEAGPLGAVEGMMSGLPLIITDSGGLPEYVGNSAVAVLEKRNAIHNMYDRIRLQQEIAETLVEFVNKRNDIFDREQSALFEKYEARSFYCRFMNIFV